LDSFFLTLTPSLCIIYEPDYPGVVSGSQTDREGDGWWKSPQETPLKSPGFIDEERPFAE
jgi:hypothetical protein